MVMSTKRRSPPCQGENPPCEPVDLTDRELTLLSFCHLYLKTFHVSDPATSDGKQIRANCLSMSPHPLPSSWDWSQQASPNERV
eukprot:1055822-Ditylum_brightwellii.AAC.1